MENTIFIYAKDGKVKALDFQDAKEQAESLLSDGWKHTATLNPCHWIEYICNNCDNCDDYFCDFVFEVAHLMGHH